MVSENDRTRCDINDAYSPIHPFVSVSCFRWNFNSPTKDVACVEARVLVDVDERCDSRRHDAIGPSGRSRGQQRSHPPSQWIDQPPSLVDSQHPDHEQALQASDEDGILLEVCRFLRHTALRFHWPPLRCSTATARSPDVWT